MRKSKTKRNKHKNRRHRIAPHKSHQVSAGQLSQQQQQSRELTGFFVKGEYYSGPIPPTSIMERYEMMCAGAADRILAMAEKQSEHRQEIEKTVVKANAKNFPRGQIVAGVIALACIASGTYLVSIGSSIIGITWMFGSIGALVGVYLHGHKAKQHSNPPPATPPQVRE